MSFRPLFTTLLVVVAFAVFAAGCAWSNVHVVSPEEVVRSAQPSGKELAALVKQFGIKSVLNLRGPFPGERWYDDEVAASKKAGVVHYDYQLSSDEDVTVDQQREIVALMQNAPKPLLIHCAWGADRTGLASALYRYGVLHHKAEEAVKELAPRYGHVVMLHRKAKAMDRSFDAFVAAAAPSSPLLPAPLPAAP